MNLPLYKECKPQKGNDFHAGLWYDRFFNRYDDAWKVPEGDKLAWINTVTSGAVGDQGKLAAFAVRQQSLTLALEGINRVFATDWHFVTGLGNNHPVENGFAWHPTLGVPYLTGAAVKGLLRGWCEVWLEWKASDEKKKQGEKDDPRLLQWFGDTKQSGQLIFFDAVPIKPVELKADIMTPHYGDWYAKGNEDPKRDGSNVPADWHDPVPVPFLVVDKGQSFQFGVALRAGSDVELPQVIEALTRGALAWLGAGAKTAAGYGRFAESPDDKRLREQQQKEAEKAEQLRLAQAAAELAAEERGLSGLATDIHVFAHQANWASDKGAFTRDVFEWLAKLEALDDVAEQKLAASLIAEFLEMHDKGVMANPNKTSGKKNKPVYKPNAVKLAVALNQVLAS